MTTKNVYIEIENAPDIAGLAFRNFRGPEDFKIMSTLVELSNKADGIREERAGDGSESGHSG